jgi:hypothetical protein
VEHGARRRGAAGEALAIDRVAQQRDAQAVEGMDADLVGAAGLGAEFDQRSGLILGQLAPAGEGGLALFAGIMRQPAAALEILESASSITPLSCSILPATMPR